MGSASASLVGAVPPSARIEQRRAVLLLLGILMVGAATRLYRIDSQCLWMDEISSLNTSAAMGRSGLAGLAGRDHVAPLHTLVLWVVTRVAGESAFWLRLPSAVAGILTIPAFYVLGVRLFRSRPVGLAAAGLVAVSPFAIWYSQEARMYALLLLVATVYVVVAWPAGDRPLRASEWLALTLVTVAGLYTHHYMILECAAFGVFLLVRLGIAHPRAWIWLGTQAVALLTFGPWLALTSEKLGAHAGVTKPMLLMWTPYTLYTFLAGFSLGPSVRDLRIDGASAALAHHAVWIVVTAVAGAIVLVAGARRTLRAETRWAGVWCLIWAVVPIALAIAATFVTNISYNVRYAVVSYPPIVLLLAAVVPQARRSMPIALAVCALTICVGWSLWGWYANPSYAKEEIRPLAAMLREQYDRGHVLVVANEHIAGLLRYYEAPLPADALLLSAADGLAASNLANVHAAIERMPARPESQIWLIEYRPWETDPGRALPAQLDSVGDLQVKREWPGVSLRVYRVHSRS